MIAEKWGALQEIDERTLSKQQLQLGRVCVITQITEPINSSINLQVEGNLYKVSIKEDVLEAGWDPYIMKADSFPESESENEVDGDSVDDGSEFMPEYGELIGEELPDESTGKNHEPTSRSLTPSRGVEMGKQVDLLKSDTLPEILVQKVHNNDTESTNGEEHSAPPKGDFSADQKGQELQQQVQTPVIGPSGH